MLDRAKAPDTWMKDREGGDDFARAHAGWVALREARAFSHPELKMRLARVQEAMRCYTLVANPGVAGEPSPAGAYPIRLESVRGGQLPSAPPWEQHRLH